MLEKFYIVHTKNKQERKAEHNLKRQGFNVWLPTFKTSLVKRNKYINKEVPFFPGYLFVKFSLKNDSWSKINNSFGVKYLISYSGIPIPINEVLINNLKKIISGNYLKVGDYVKFVCGPLKNYKGKNKSIKNPNLASLESSIEEKTGIKVFIRNKKNNTGQVTFEYKDLDQLNRLIMVIKANY